MVRLTAEIKRGFLQALYLQAQASATPLPFALSNFLLNAFPSVSSGRLVISHAGAGKSTTFQIPQIGDQFRQEEIFGLAQELTEVYNDSKQVIVNNPLIPQPAAQPGSCFTDGTGITFTVTTVNPHGLTNSSVVNISNTNIILFSGEFTITSTGSNTFTCPIAAAVGEPVTASNATITTVSLLPDLSDSNVFQVMMADPRLQDIWKVQPDFTTLLFPWR